MTVKEPLQSMEKSTSINISSSKYDGASKMNTHRKTAMIVGVLFIIGTVSGVLSVGFLGDLLEGVD